MLSADNVSNLFCIALKWQSIQLAEAAQTLEANVATLGSATGLPAAALAGLRNYYDSQLLQSYFGMANLNTAVQSQLEIDDPYQAFQAIVQTAGGVAAYKRAWDLAGGTGNSWSWLRSGFCNTNVTVYDVLVNRRGWVWGASSTWHDQRNARNNLWDAMHFENNPYLRGGR